MKAIVSMVALEGFLRSIASPFIRFFAEFSEKIEDLQNTLLDVNQQMNNIQAKADAEKRKLSADEETMITELFMKFEAAEAEIERRNRIAAANARLQAPNSRKTDPPTPPKPNNRRTVEFVNTDDPGKCGFRSFGEFALAVKNASPGSGQMNIDPRLIAMAAPTAGSIGREDIGADGGFAVPPDFRTEIQIKVTGEESLLSRTDQMQSASNSVTWPKDETTPWQTSGGVQAYWEVEGGLKTQSKPQLEPMTIRLNKLAALVPITDELLEDAPAMSTYLRRKVPEKINFKVNNAIVNGTGVGQPLGLVNSPAKITVAAEGGQAADTVVFNNITKMWSRLYGPARANAIWLINQDIETQLYTMAFPTGTLNFPAYLPPGGLSAAPFGMLMGRPVIPTEAAQTLGDEGDIILTDLSQYLTIQKVGGIRSDVSIHLWFDYDITAFRFVLRIGGQPWWSAPIVPLNGPTTRSTIVTLATRP